MMQKIVVRSKSFLLPEVTIHHLWAGLPIFILLWKCFLFPLPLLDFWWHLKAGQVIVNMRAIPRIDLFSYTAAGQTFILGNWLAEIIYYSLYSLGGLPLLVFANSLLLLAAFVPVYHLCWEATSRFRVCVLSAAVAALCFFVGARTQIFSFFFFAIYYWVLSGFRASRRDYLWALPVLMVFWVNLHGGFVLGMLLIGIFLCTEGAKTYLNPASPGRLRVAELRKLVVVLVLCFVATIAHPEGLGIYTYLHTVAADPSSQKLVVEWQPPRIDTLQGGVLFYLPFFLLLTALIYSETRPDPTDAVLFLASSAFALTATRNIIWFIIISAPLIARYFPAMPGAAHGGETRARGLDSGRRILNLLLACIAISVLMLFSPWVRPRVYGTSLLAPGTPVGAIDYIQSRGLQGKIFHPQEYGDYLIWRLWPQHQSFIDGRVHLFSESFVREYQQIFCDSGWERLLQPYGVRYLLLNKSREQSERVRMIESARKSSAWSVLFEDETTVLFEKTLPTSRTASLR